MKTETINSVTGLSLMSSSSSKLKWGNLTGTIERIKTFLGSLDAELMYTGFAKYDGKQLIPLKTSKILCMIERFAANDDPNKRSLDDLTTAFTALHTDIKILEESLSQFHPRDSESNEAAENLSLELIEVEGIIKGKAKKNLKQLFKNYQDAWFSLDPNTADRVNRLNLKSKDCLKLLDNIQLSFCEKLLNQSVYYKNQVDLTRYTKETQRLINGGERYCKHLRSITVSYDEGVVVPANFIFDCKGNIEEPKPSKEELKAAVNFIKLPSLAKKIPIPGMKGEWIPLRPDYNENDEIVIKEGVVGTCERQDLNGDHQGNCYYFYNPDSGNLAFGAAAINTALKAEEMAKIIRDKFDEHQVTKRGVIIHQCNSFTGEANLLSDVHAQVSKIKTLLYDNEIGDQKTPVLHINTAFNIATKWPLEEGQSVKKINIDSLVQLTQFVIDDIKNAKNNFQTDSIEKVDRLCTNALELVQVIKTQKQSIRQSSLHHKDQIPDHFDEDDEYGFVVIEKPMEEETLSVANPIHSDDPKTSLEDTIRKLADNQTTLMGKLNEILQSLEELIPDENNKPGLEITLPLDIMKLILKAQLKYPGSPPISRCKEIELFFMLYRLLNIHPVITCWSGSDRSGFLRAMFTALSKIEEEFFERMQKEFPQEDEPVVRLKAIERVFQLVGDLDENRLHLFDLLNALKVEKDFDLVTDLKDWNTKEFQKFSIRDELFQKIDREFTPQVTEGEENENSDPLDALLAQRLKDTLYYLELVCGHLLGPEAEKTFNSTGVIGFKYHHDGSVSANPHPLERLPPFITVSLPEDKKRTIETIILSRSWLRQWLPLGWDSLAFTPAGVAITHRVGKLRGS